MEKSRESLLEVAEDLERLTRKLTRIRPRLKEYIDFATRTGQVGRDIFNFVSLERDYFDNLEEKK